MDFENYFLSTEAECAHNIWSKTGLKYGSWVIVECFFDQFSNFMEFFVVAFKLFADFQK